MGNMAYLATSSQVYYVDYSSTNLALLQKILSCNFSSSQELGWFFKTQWKCEWIIWIIILHRDGDRVKLEGPPCKK